MSPIIVYYILVAVVVKGTNYQTNFFIIMIIITKKHELLKQSNSVTVGLSILFQRSIEIVGMTRYSWRGKIYVRESKNVFQQQR